MDDSKEADLTLAEYVNLPTTVDFNTIYSDRFQAFAKGRTDFRVGTVFANDYAPVYTSRDHVDALFNELGADYLSFYPKILSPLDEQSNYASGITQILNQPYLNLSGRNVIIGFVDTGIDYTKPAFAFENGTTKILDIWDQTIDGQRPDYLYFGSAYTSADINRALAQPDPFSVVPSRDTDGHGTFLASVAAGNDAGQTIGAAPKAYIISVKLRRANPYYIKKYLIEPSNPNLFEETDILLGIKYILDRSEELNLPVVICIGLGSNRSGHDGNTYFEDYIDFVSQRVGYAFVAAAGNESNAKHHTQGSIPRTGTSDSINLKIGVPDVSVPMVIYGSAYDKLSVSITSPTGETISRVPFKAGLSFSEGFVFERASITISYFKNVNTVIYVELRNATQGIWEITLYGDSILSGDYYAWVPITGQVNPSVEFLRPVPESTIVFPATGESSVTCGAYNTRDGSLFAASSWGPTRQPRMSPDLVAPGVNVRGIYPTGNGIMSGTSVAAAVTAGAAAMLLEWGIVKGNLIAMNGDLLRILLCSGCQREEDMIYPNIKWGYGKLDLFGTFNVIKETSVNRNMS